MIYKIPSSSPQHLCIVFELPASLWADRVFAVGNFGEGQPSRIPLTQGRTGEWRATLDLPMGRQYTFRYLVDGEWRTDYHADGFTTTAGGILTSLINTQPSTPSPALTPSATVQTPHLVTG
jgi:hypothetical protein